MHELIASPFLGDHLVTRPDSEQGVKIGHLRYLELASVAPTNPLPSWLIDAAKRRWAVDHSGRLVRDTLLIREESPYGMGRASWELNLGCNYDCPFCYLGEKRFSGMSWPQRQKLLHIMREAGVLWLQMTGGEPLIDKGFPDSYALAWDLGMMIQISSNGSRLSDPRVLELLTTRRPYRITVSVYGATEASYDATTQRRGSFAKFIKGLEAAIEAGLPVKLNLVVATTNDHEVSEMQALAGRFGCRYDTYSTMSATIHGTGEPMPMQSAAYQRNRKPFGGCNAGVTFFHVDPHGKASICKIGREPNVDLMAEGVEGLPKLAAIADGLHTRTGGCSGCTLSGTCWVCRPMAKLYQEAHAPLVSYCQHGGR